MSACITAHDQAALGPDTGPVSVPGIVRPVGKGPIVAATARCAHRLAKRARLRQPRIAESLKLPGHIARKTAHSDTAGQQETGRIVRCGRVRPWISLRSEDQFAKRASCRPIQSGCMQANGRGKAAPPLPRPALACSSRRHIPVPERFCKLLLRGYWRSTRSSRRYRPRRKLR